MGLNMGLHWAISGLGQYPKVGNGRCNSLFLKATTGKASLKPGTDCVSSATYEPLKLNGKP